MHQRGKCCQKVTVTIYQNYWKTWEYYVQITWLLWFPPYISYQTPPPLSGAPQSQTVPEFSLQQVGTCAPDFARVVYLFGHQGSLCLAPRIATEDAVQWHLESENIRTCNQRLQSLLRRGFIFILIWDHLYHIIKYENQFIILIKSL